MARRALWSCIGFALFCIFTILIYDNSKAAEIRLGSSLKYSHAELPVARAVNPAETSRTTLDAKLPSLLEAGKETQADQEELTRDVPDLTNLVEVRESLRVHFKAAIADSLKPFQRYRNGSLVTLVTSTYAWSRFAVKKMPRTYCKKWGHGIIWKGKFFMRRQTRPNVNGWFRRSRTKYILAMIDMLLQKNLLPDMILLLNTCDWGGMVPKPNTLAAVTAKQPHWWGFLRNLYKKLAASPKESAAWEDQSNSTLLPLLSYAPCSAYALDLPFPASWGLHHTVEHLFETFTEVVPWHQKKKKALWRGTCHSGDKATEFRKNTVDALSNNPDDFDVACTQYGREEYPNKSVPMAQWVSYKYLVWLPGPSLGSSTLHQMLYMDAVLLMLQLPCGEFYYGALKPYVHYVPVDPEMPGVTGFLKAIRWAKAHDDQAKQISANARAFITHFRIEDIAELYVKPFLTAYAGVISDTTSQESYCNGKPVRIRAENWQGVDMKNVFECTPREGSKYILTGRYGHEKHKS